MSPTTPSSARPSSRRRSRRPGGGDPATTAGVRRPGAVAGEPVAAIPEASELVAVADVEDFAALGVPASLVQALRAMGVERPFPVQVAALPPAIEGRDVLARGRTGSGKTVAFALPLVLRLAGGPKALPRRPRGLILVPTRELATQVAATVSPLAATAGLRVTTVFGGVSQRPQEQAFAAGVDIVVACPGRLEDLVGQRVCSLANVEVSVLDEADHLADLGFLPAVRRLLDATPAGGQRLLFSATLDAQVDAVVKRYLTEPVRCSVDPALAAPVRIDHHVLVVANDHKGALVAELAAGEGPTLLFTRTKHAARKLARRLNDTGTAAVELHGNLAQNARDRNMAAFREGRARVLVATDIAARGIHVDGVALVVHVDPPAEAKAFTHRSGRTARAGSDGTVVTVVTPEQRDEVATMIRKAAIAPTITTVTPSDVLVAELRGPKAAPMTVVVAPAVVERAGAAPAGGARRRGSNAPGGGSRRAGSSAWAGRGRRAG